MSLLRHFGALSHVLVLLSILAACLSQDAIWMLVTAGGVGAASRVVTEGPRGVTLGRRTSLLLTAIILAVAVGRLMMDPGTPAAVDALITFGVWTTVVKLYERRTVEIDAERLTLSVLLIVLACLDGFDLVFGLVLLVWSVLCVVCILLFQLHYGANRDRGERAFTEDDEQRGATIGQHVRLHFRRALLLTVLFVLGSSVLLFLVFPRGVSPQLESAEAARVVKTGAGESADMTLVSGMRIVESPTEVATVALTTLAGGAGVAPAQLYLRTATASEYAGHGRWHPSPNRRDRRTFVQSAEEVGVYFGEGEADWMLRMNFMRSPRFIPVPSGTTAIRSGSPLMLEVDRGRGIIEVEGGEVVLLQVRSTSGVLAARGGSLTVHPAHAWATRLAREILSQRGVSAQPRSAHPEALTQWRIRAAEAMVAHLRSDYFRYTLDLSRIGQADGVRAMDPIRRFLMVEPAGNCEYFAAAFVLLTQGLGLDSRVVSGFRVSPEVPDGSDYLIRGRDAHSWAEVRVDLNRWIRFDPTAARRSDITIGPAGVLDTMRDWYQQAEAWWRLYILGYDASLQETVAERVLPGPAAWVENALAAVKALIERIDRAYGLRRFGSFYVGGVLLFLALTAWILLRERGKRRRFGRRLGLHSRSDRNLRGPVAEIYRSMLAAMRRAGVEKPPHLPPATWSDLLTAERPDIAPIVDRIVGAFYASHYGGRRLDGQGLAAVERDLKSLQAALRSGR